LRHEEGIKSLCDVPQPPGDAGGGMLKNKKKTRGGGRKKKGSGESYPGGDLTPRVDDVGRDGFRKNMTK